jgi:hypothetical protein
VRVSGIGTSTTSKALKPNPSGKCTLILTFSPREKEKVETVMDEKNVKGDEHSFVASLSNRHSDTFIV